MSTMTEKYGLFKYNTDTDGLQKFNINLALNDNWDKVENAINNTNEALSTTKNNVDTLRENLIDGSLIVNRTTHDANGNVIASTYETKVEAEGSRVSLATTLNANIESAKTALNTSITTGDNATLSEAKTYADGVGTSTLTAANAYADQVAG